LPIEEVPVSRVLQEIDRNGERYLLLFLYTTIVIAVSTEVVRRFLLSYSSVWGEEVARYAFIYLVWIGASAGVRNRNHLRIDFILHLLPTRGQGAVNLFGDLATLALALLALYWSLGPIATSLEYGSVTAGLRISEAWFMAAVPLGFGMMILRLVQNMVGDWADLRHGRATRGAQQLFE
jgi:TRAP-type C4-dicarboxylate transport system permease small subunit